jgi:hypothetical protein
MPSKYSPIPKDGLTFAEADAALRYEPETGRIFWKVVRQRVRVGREAGCVNPTDGYRKIRINGAVYQSHRVSWLLHYGAWPNGFLDHINRDRSDNRIANLREADRSLNMHNKDKQGTRGLQPGVRLRGDSWMVRIDVGTMTVTLGCWKDYRKAGESYRIAERMILDGFQDEIIRLPGSDKLPSCEGGETVFPPGWQRKSSDFFGVKWDFEKQKWRAHPRIKGAFVQLGYFNSEDDAIDAVLSHFVKNQIKPTRKLAMNLLEMKRQFGFG